MYATWSISRRCSKTAKPTCSLVSSGPSNRSSSAIDAAACSMTSSSIGRPLAAAAMPSVIFACSNGTRSPDRFRTIKGTNSSRSKVVNRAPQARHSRRRRMASPSSDCRESTTLSSRWAQAGQRTRRNYCEHHDFLCHVRNGCLSHATWNAAITTSVSRRDHSH